MGSAHPDGYKDEKPVHRATVSTGFFMGVFPVTQAHWKAVMDSEPSRFTGSNKPVEQVSWAECQEFCTKLKAHLGEPYSVRLPTEVEWEWACRAGTTTEFHFGDTINTDLANNGGELWWLAGTVDGDPGQQTTDVRTFVANPWGLCDLHGNVQEWSADQFRGYSRDEQPNHRGGSGENTRIVRGGGWRSHPRSCRAAARCGYAPEIRCDGIGFRVAFRQA
jgi:formylglycine-generating enzyme required for sulfatase activity